LVKAVEAPTIAPVAAVVPTVPITVPDAAPKTIPLDWINQVQLGDCIAYMKQLPANSIDMVCTDPPYFLDGLGSDWNKESLDQKGSSSRVGNLPKGMKFDRNQSKKFHAFYTQVSAEIFRVLKPGGAFLSSAARGSIIRWHGRWKRWASKSATCSAGFIPRHK
jgi:DNA modification methylase